MKRREILRKTGAGLAASTAAMGVASAGTGDDPAAIEDGAELAADVLDRNDDLLADLAADGLLDDADLALRDEDVTETVGSVGGRTTTVLATERSVDAGDLVVHVLPEYDAAFATLKAGDGVETYGDVSPDDDCTSCEYEVCTCVDPCDPYGCCEYSCSCMTKCECGGPLCPA